MNNPNNETNILLYSLKKGDNKAFVRIYDEYWESLYAIGMNRLQSKTDVEDIIQELFADLWNKRESIQIKENLRIYLLTAMKYKVIDHIRKRKIDASKLDDVKSDLKLSINSTDQILSFNELYDRLKEGIDRLPDQCKLVFKMSRELGMSSSEIAGKLKVSKRTVETQIYKSLKQLKGDFSDYPSLILFLSPSLFDIF